MVLIQAPILVHKIATIFLLVFVLVNENNNTDLP